MYHAFLRANAQKRKAKKCKGEDRNRTSEQWYNRTNDIRVGKGVWG